MRALRSWMPSSEPICRSKGSPNSSRCHRMPRLPNRASRTSRGTARKNQVYAQDVVRSSGLVDNRMMAISTPSTTPITIELTVRMMVPRRPWMPHGHGLDGFRPCPLGSSCLDHRRLRVDRRIDGERAGFDAPVAENLLVRAVGRQRLQRVAEHLGERGLVLVYHRAVRGR